MVNGTTILVVEEAPGLLTLEAEHLASAGCVLRTAATAEDAMRALRREPVDLLLLDHPMSGGLDALAFYARVREAGCDSPTILVTARADDALLARASRTGIRNVLARSPHDLNRLREIVERILEQRAAERERATSLEALARSELPLLRQMWERSLDAMRLTDGAGTILRVNEAYCRLVGKPREVLEGRSFSLGYVEAERDGALARHREHFASGRGETMVLRPITLWDGRKVHLEFSSSFLEAPGGPPLLLSIIRDISPRVALEGQLRQAQKMEAIGRLAGGVAHDFNNLLTVINGYGELVYHGLSADAPQRQLIAEVIKAGEHAANLTGQLLAFSRKQVLAPEILDLNEVVEDMRGLLRRLIGEDVSLTAVPGPGLWRVKVDPGGVQQVIVNLAVNARDAMPEGGGLTIETKNVYLDEQYAQSRPEARSGPHVLLAVSDTGCGMDAVTLSRAFEPFFTTKGDRGTGLGLATVYGVVKQSGGHIGLYSEPGKGTTFKVYFPRAEGEKPSGKSFPGVSLLRGAETVLLVEDDDGIRALAERILESCGYAVVSACDGMEALEVAGRHPGKIDLLITDVVMPRLGGGQLAERLTAERPGLRVLYLSGYTEDAVVRHGVLEAKAAFLHKPFAIAALTQKVREVLDSGEPRGS